VGRLLEMYRRETWENASNVALRTVFGSLRSYFHAAHQNEDVELTVPGGGRGEDEKSDEKILEEEEVHDVQIIEDDEDDVQIVEEDNDEVQIVENKKAVMQIAEDGNDTKDGSTSMRIKTSRMKSTSRTHAYILDNRE
jgi:hypothetical protein